jgi:N-acetylglucosamine-6-phosphate deacetylase
LTNSSLWQIRSHRWSEGSSKRWQEIKEMIIRGRHFLTGEIHDLHLADGLIQAISAPGKDQDVLGGEDYWVAPGLIDIQVNGYAGHDFCSGDTTADDVAAVAERITDAGVTAFCPTVITNSYAAMEKSMRAVATACERNAVACDRVLTIHMEGPYLSRIEGPRGAHPLEHVRDPDWDEFVRLQEAAGGRIGLVTLAPDSPNALEFISRATKAGVLIAIGHHTATREQINAAVVAGAVMITHLGNGVHEHLHRHRNYLWEQLANDALLASMIVDGHHLPPALVKSFYRVKGSSRLIMISDAISAAGLPPGRYQVMGRDIEVKEDGSVRLTGTPFFAGSTLRLCDAIPKVIAMAGASLGDAITMAAVNPAQLLGTGRGYGFLRVGAPANLILLRANERYELALTIAGGKVCYSSL